MTPPQTAAVDVLLIAYRSLTVEEREEMLEQVVAERLKRLTSTETELAGYLRSVSAAAEQAGVRPARTPVRSHHHGRRSTDKPPPTTPHPRPHPPPRLLHNPA